MKSFLLAAALGVVSAFEAAEMHKFTSWMGSHGKSYKTVEEFEFRLVQFLRREEAIMKHNAEEHSYTMGHNARSDWSDMEFEAILGYIAPLDEDRDEIVYQQGKGSA